MRDYFKKATWVLDDAAFTYLGGRYRGRGLLTWEPDTGFHLEALVTRSGPPLPDKVQLWQGRLATRHDRTSIRMRIQHGGRAFAVVALADRLDVLTQDRLSCSLRSVRFMTRLSDVTRKAPRWSGSALIALGSSLLWPDKVVRTTELAGTPFRQSFESKGLSHDTLTLTVRGQEDDGYLDLHWSMEKVACRRSDAWRWPTAFCDALSIESGHSLPLLERELLAFSRQHTERCKALKVVPLHPFQPFDGDFIDKVRLFALTDFFMKDSREARLCRRLFDQMVRAKQQTRWDDAELILSTALEGVLRALDRVPSSNRKWQLDASLAHFRQTYLSPEWRQACKHALSVFEHLRHSTAHPDWIVDKTALEADAERSTSFQGLKFLSRFYGYMILAMAGLQPQPIFGGRSLAPQASASTPGRSGSSEVM